MISIIKEGKKEKKENLGATIKNNKNRQNI